jgi:hypothetical protein
MTRVVLVTVVLTAFPVISRCEERVVRMKVRPMPSPKPALRYQLLPEVRELHPGNPVHWYIRCFQEQRLFFFSKQSVAERARYQSMPLDKLPADQLRRYGGSALTQADWAARLDTPDWEVLERIQTEGLDLTLPELGPLQALGAALQVRFRAQVAGRHFDEAINTARTMFALARHLGEHPTGAANQVGLSVAHLALDTLEEMIQQPGSPNLYWALTDLPSPLVEQRKGIQGDRALVAAELRGIRHDAAMSEAEVEKVMSRVSGLLGFARQQAGLPPRRLRAELQARARDQERLRTAYLRLIKAFGAGILLKKFSHEQVILLDEKLAHEAACDERRKLLALTPWQIDALPGAGKSENDKDGLFADLLPDVIKVRRALGRLEQRLALLRHVEALRLYAAAHGGKWPEKLADVPVPLPLDPFTGKPFVYTVQSANASLRGRPPRGEEQNPEYNVRYVLTLQR